MGEVVVETQQGDVTFEIKGDTPTPYEETRIMRKVRDLQYTPTEIQISDSKKDEQLFDTTSGIKDAGLRAKLSAAENPQEEELQLRKLYGMTEEDYIRDSRGRLALTPSGGKKIGVDLEKATLIDESGFSRYDFADLAGIAPEVILGVGGAL